MQGILVVEARDLVSGAENGSLIDAVQVVAAGSAPRRPPTYVNFDAVPDDLKSRVKDPHSHQTITYPNTHLLTFVDALVVGQGSVVVRTGTGRSLIKDSAREFIAHNNAPDFMALDGDGRYSVAHPIAKRIGDRCLLLQRPWSNNFGHWMVDQAMALSYLRHTGNLITHNIVVAKVHSPQLREIMFQTIKAILPTATVYEHPDNEVWQFAVLDYIMPLHVPPMFKLPAALDCLREDILAAPGAGRSGPFPKQIYIVRQGSTRKLVNEPEIATIAALYGFEPVIPEALSLAEQAALFNRAEAVLGIKGAAMTNILFATPKCSLMVMSSSQFTDPFFFDIASSRGVGYSEVFGETVDDKAFISHSDFYVPPHEVEAMIRATLTAPPWGG